MGILELPPARVDALVERVAMSLPEEKRRALQMASDFLLRLPFMTRVPKEVRAMALRCMRHYPSAIEIARFRMSEEWRGEGSRDDRGDDERLSQD